MNESSSLRVHAPGAHDTGRSAGFVRDELSQLRMERLGCRTLSVCLRMDFTKDAESTGFIQAGCTLYHPLPRFCGNSCLSYSSRFNTLSGHRMEAGHVGEVGLPVEGSRASHTCTREHFGSPPSHSGCYWYWTVPPPSMRVHAGCS